MQREKERAHGLGARRREMVDKRKGNSRNKKEQNFGTNSHRTKSTIFSPSVPNFRSNDFVKQEFLEFLRK
jgi:hypothetical protein